MKHISTATALTTLVTATAIALMTLGPRVIEADALGGDKIQHLLGFGAIILPATLFRPRWLFWLAPATLLSGGLIELLQTQTGREGSVEDWLADGFGIVLATGLGLLARRILTTSKKARDSPAAT